MSGFAREGWDGNIPFDSIGINEKNVVAHDILVGLTSPSASNVSFGDVRVWLVRTETLAL